MKKLSLVILLAYLLFSGCEKDSITNVLPSNSDDALVETTANASKTVLSTFTKPEKNNTYSSTKRKTNDKRKEISKRRIKFFLKLKKRKKQ